MDIKKMKGKALQDHEIDENPPFAIFDATAALSFSTAGSATA